MKTIIMADTINFLSKQHDTDTFKLVPHLLSIGFEVKETPTEIQYLVKTESFVDAVQLSLFD